MNETTRTITFVAIAAVVGLVAWTTQPAPPVAQSANANPFPKFDVSDASSFTIVQFEKDDAKLNSFQVKKEDRRWVIPSHGNYPADAEEQLKKIAAEFVDLKPITKASEKSEEFGIYGVKEPTKELSIGEEGVGRLITLADSKDNSLLSLIVGKKAQADSSDGPAESGDLHFVRVAGEDAVYVAKISDSVLTTKFADWIKQDLLGMSAFDVAKMQLRDYSVALFSVPGEPDNVVPKRLSRLDTTVSWDGAKSQWELDQMSVFRDDESETVELADDEELNKSKLDGVKTAVDDLKIIDVDAKPKKLQEALKSERVARNNEAVQSLYQFGFFVMPNEQKKLEIYGKNGGLKVSMKDGVQYVLNFGNAKNADQGDSTKLNRYLMVTAKVDDSMLPPPQLEPEEPAPAGPESPTPSTEAKPDEAPKSEDAGEKKETDESSSSAAQEKTEEKSDEQKKAEEAAEKAREKVRKENQRKLSDFREKKQKAQQRVDELNSRFGDWFYVVSDDVYKKVQLGRADIVKDRESAKEEGFGVDAFRKLEESGIAGKESSAPPPAPTGIPGLPGFGE